LPTQADGAARSEFDQAARSPASRATCDLRAAPNSGIQDQNKAATLTQLSCLEGSARWRYISAQKKGGLKFLCFFGAELVRVRLELHKQ